MIQKLNEQLEKLNDAIYSNVKVVKFENKEVHYRTTAELLAAKENILNELNRLKKRNTTVRKAVYYDPR